MAKKAPIHKRNGNIFDKWSILHLSIGISLGWIMPPIIAMALMTLWEPFEIFVLSPILMRHNIIFGYETLRNSLSDIFFNSVGIITGALMVGTVMAPPFHLF